MPDWPQNADGEVFRRLLANGFDFSEPLRIDFNVDFAKWPPASEAIEALQSRYAIVKVYDEDRYILIQIEANLTYEFVIRTQAAISEQVHPFGGICESWGVLR